MHYKYVYGVTLEEAWMMQYVDEFRDPELAKALLAQIRELFHNGLIPSLAHYRLWKCVADIRMPF